MFVGFVVLAAALVSALAPKATHALVATLVQVTNTIANPVPTAPAVPGSQFFIVSVALLFLWSPHLDDGISSPANPFSNPKDVKS